jgi:hypothetical protein
MPNVAASAAMPNVTPATVTLNLTIATGRPNVTAAAGLRRHLAAVMWILAAGYRAMTRRPGSLGEG